MSQYKMIVDLTKCSGCGSCAIACKIGNNTQKTRWGQTFNWADFITETKGYFPNTRWTALPVSCNHCSGPSTDVPPPCCTVCPVDYVDDNRCVGGKRRAMYKLTDAYGGFVLHDDERCIGCQACQRACPYSTASVGAFSAHFSVISYNVDVPFGYLTSVDEYIANCTASENDVRAQVGELDVAPAYRNKWTCKSGDPLSWHGGMSAPVTEIHDLRRKAVVEKCYFCAHRLFDTSLGLTENEGERRPYCVLACPAKARELTTTEPSDAKVLAHKKYTQLKRVVLVSRDTVDSKCRPNVYYKGSFSKR